MHLIATIRPKMAKLSRAKSKCGQKVEHKRNKNEHRLQSLEFQTDWNRTFAFVWPKKFDWFLVARKKVIWVWFVCHFIWIRPIKKNAWKYLSILPFHSTATAPRHPIVSLSSKTPSDLNWHLKINQKNCDHFDWFAESRCSRSTILSF